MHPLNANHKRRALARYLEWQLSSRVLGFPVIMNFVNNSRMIVSAGMTGATGNLYCGLHEFEEMSFLLHLLRPGDTFYDVGANVGAYTVLSSAAIGANTIAFEPIPTTFRALTDNISLNCVESLVTLLNIGVGRENCSLKFTSELDTTNHVIPECAALEQAISVPVKPLDDITTEQFPRLLKIDVEGFETEVIAGASNLLDCPDLHAVIMELNGSGERYGFDEDRLHQKMLDHEFNVYRYYPFERKLVRQEMRINEGNSIYVRKLDEVADRVFSAPPFVVLDQTI